MRETRDVVATLTGTADALDDGTTYGEAVHRLLAVVRAQLGMKVAWVSEFVGSEQVLRFVDAEHGADAPAQGTCLPLGGSFCARVLDGRFPALIPDARSQPEASLLDVTAALHIGAYVGVPLMGPQGTAVGMLCAINDVACPGMSERDVASLRLLADLLRDFQLRAQSEAETEQAREQVRAGLRAVIAGRGRHAVLQPIVDVTTGRAVAAEGLTRFTLPSPAVAGGGQRAAAPWFDDAARLGLAEELELATAASLLDLLDDRALVPQQVALTVNLSPQTLTGSGLHRLLAGRDLSRTVVEITEHAPVEDYAVLAAVLAPYRERGLRIAVDDAGAGYASFRHVLAVRPDLVKVDMALVRGADDDVARRALLHALAGFAGSLGCSLVAEGVETAGELRAVVGCGIPLVQGYHLCEPTAAPPWDGYPL